LAADAVGLGRSQRATWAVLAYGAHRAGTAAKAGIAQTNTAGRNIGGAHIGGGLAIGALGAGWGWIEGVASNAVVAKWAVDAIGGTSSSSADSDAEAILAGSRLVSGIGAFVTIVVNLVC
jgi:hypothetical protein